MGQALTPRPAPCHPGPGPPRVERVEKLSAAQAPTRQRGGLAVPCRHPAVTSGSHAAPSRAEPRRAGPGRPAPPHAGRGTAAQRTTREDHARDGKYRTAEPQSRSPQRVTLPATGGPAAGQRHRAAVKCRNPRFGRRSPAGSVLCRGDPSRLPRTPPNLRWGPGRTTPGSRHFVGFRPTPRRHAPLWYFGQVEPAAHTEPDRGGRRWAAEAAINSRTAQPSRCGSEYAKRTP